MPHAPAPSQSPLRPARHPFARGWVGCAALLALALTACGAKAADDAANAFMVDLNTGNNAAAFAMVTPSLQQKFGGTVEAMGAQIKKFGQQPTEWSFNSINVTNGVARLHGAATFVGGAKGAVDMELVEQTGTWRVASVGFAK